MGSKAIKSIIICVLILGIFLEVEGKSCCKTTLARNCYNVCRRIRRLPRLVCAKLCRCKIINGNTCPSDFPKLNFIPNSGKVEAYYFHLPYVLFFTNMNLFTYKLINCLAGEPDAIEYCNLGCVSSMCDIMDNGKFI